jgi:hypothetical protein
VPPGAKVGRSFSRLVSFERRSIYAISVGEEVSEVSALDCGRPSKK